MRPVSSFETLLCFDRHSPHSAAQASSNYLIARRPGQPPSRTLRPSLYRNAAHRHLPSHFCVFSRGERGLIGCTSAGGRVRDYLARRRGSVISIRVRVSRCRLRGVNPRSPPVVRETRMYFLVHMRDPCDDVWPVWRRREGQKTAARCAARAVGRGSTSAHVTYLGDGRLSTPNINSARSRPTSPTSLSSYTLPGSPLWRLRG